MGDEAKAPEKFSESKCYEAQEKVMYFKAVPKIMFNTSINRSLIFRSPLQSNTRGNNKDN